MNYQYTSDLVTDVLFRAGEPTDAGSDYYTRVLVYLNRAYHALCQGGSELSQNVNEDWLWLLRHGVLTLEPYTTYTATAVIGSTTLGLNTAPVDYTGAPVSVAGWTVTSDADIGGRYRVVTHTTGSTTLTLDSPWVRPSGSYKISLEKLHYALPADTLRLVSPIVAWNGQNYQAIEYAPMETMWSVNPRRWTNVGAPLQFTVIDQTTIAFSAAPTMVTRADYEYLYLPPALTNASNEEPVVPLKDRRILADIALFWLLLDKNDNRADSLSLLVNGQLRGMASENRAAIAAVARKYGSLIRSTPPTLSGYRIR